MILWDRQPLSSGPSKIASRTSPLKTMRLGIVTIALLSGSALLQAGCASPFDASPARSDVLRVSYSDDPDTLNPLIGGDAAGALFQSFVYEPLADRNMAEPDKLVPRLAEKWEFDKNRLECTVHLR